MSITESLPKSRKYEGYRPEVETAKVKFLTSFTTVALSSFKDDLVEIDTNPILAIRNIACFPEETDAVSQALGFNIGEQGVENIYKNLRSAKEFLTKGAIDTIKTVTSKINARKTLTVQEQNLQIGIDTATTPTEEEFTLTDFKTTLENHFLANGNMNLAKIKDPKQRAIIKLRNPEIRKEILAAIASGGAIWRVAENFDLPYKGVSDLCLNYKLTEKGQIIRRNPDRRDDLEFKRIIKEYVRGH
jgi:hypothetical protein